MKEQLDKLIGQMVSVIVPISGGISISIRGEFGKYRNLYHVCGNPAVKFHFGNVDEIDNDFDGEVPIIRLRA
jgi:hypothetical protein